MPNPNIELQRLRAKQIKVLAKVGTNLAQAIRNLAADHLAGLSNEDVAAVLSTDAVKKALGNVGSTKVQAVKVKPTTASKQAYHCPNAGCTILHKVFNVQRSRFCASKVRGDATRLV